MPQDNIPDNLCCNITMALYVDPVITADGHTYERAAIEDHFRLNSTSPNTNLELPHKNLVPNIIMKTQCIEWKETEARKRKDIGALCHKCFQGNNNVDIVIQTITQMIELVTESDLCILQMSQLNKIKHFLRITEKFTNDVESVFDTLYIACKERHNKGIQKVSEMKQMREVHEQSIVTQENVVKEKVATVEDTQRKLARAQTTYIDAIAAFENAKTVFENAKENVKKVKSELHVARKAQRVDTSRLKQFKKLTNVFKEWEIKLSAVLDPLDRIDDENENVPPAVSNSSSCGEKRKSSSSSSNTAVKRQKIDNMGLQKLFAIGFGYLCGPQNMDNGIGKQMIESAATSGFPMAIAICVYHGWSGYIGDKENVFKMFMDYRELKYVQHYIGCCYLCGNGVAADKKEAFKWFTKSANAGNSHGQCYLGDCYFYGHGVAVDKKEAFKWYMKSANAGNSFGQFKLGGCYEIGDGVAQDKEEAKRWLTKSANAGCG